MPQYPEDQTNGRMFTRHWDGEPKWILASQSEFDGLAPSQIVRYANAEDRGFGDTESQHEVAARLDATPDADNLETNQRATDLDAKGVTVDAHRYVVDPLVEQHQYLGLYTAGPVRHVEEQVRDGAHKRIQQVLTRTFCAGHGYFVDELGRYHPVWKTAGGGWTGVNPDKKQVVYAREDDGPDAGSDMDETLPEDFTPDMVREYATADDCLKAHRPWLESKLSPYMVLHPEAFPNTFVREVYWREFTHESIAALEELGSDRARLEAVVAYHFTEKVAPQVLDAHCRLDPATNTVIFVCSLMYVELGEPESPDDLLDLPCLVSPCTRETLRMFGWNQLRDGEGYRYTHVFKWPRLKDTPAVRSVLEFVQDNKPVERTDKHDAASSWILALLARHDQDEHPGWASYEDSSHGVSVVGMGSDDDGSDEDQADNTGRLVTYADTPRAADASLTISEVQFYRIAQQKCDVEQDGSLSFTIVLQKAEWHGADDGYNWEDEEHPGTRQLAGIASAEGWGKAEHRVIPSVPRENAIPTLLGIQGSTYRLVVDKRQTEGADGHSDVSFQQFPLYNYGATSGPDDPDQTPPNVQNPFNIDFDAVRQGYDPYPRPSYNVTYEHVAPGSVGPLIDKIRRLMGGDPEIDVVYHPEGYYTVRARGTGKTPRHIREWLVSADWYHHETVEQWLGVTVERKDGKLGFYADDEESDSDTEADDWHSIDEIRGDLDANWMGSDPQDGEPVRYISTGKSDAKDAGHEYDHEDEHGNGWDGSDWDDPDEDEGNAGGPDDPANAGDSPDKARSHVITSVRPSINEDGTWNFSIHRNYPHQRVHYWETRQARKKGDWRPVYHAEYRNWPSRKAIFHDLVERFSEMVGVDVTGEDYTWGFNPNVNVHGLVDAADVTLAPVIWNKRGGKSGSSAADEGIDTSYDYEWGTLPASYKNSLTARTDPSAAPHTPAFDPFLGYYFYVRRRPHYDGFFLTRQKARAALAALSISTEIHESGSGFSFSYDGAWENGVVYNGDFPKAENNWGGQDAASRKSKMADHFQAVWSLNHEDSELLAEKCSAHMTVADWEYWFAGGDPQNPGGGGGNQGGGGNAGDNDGSD